MSVRLNHEAGDYKREKGNVIFNNTANASPTIRKWVPETVAMWSVLWTNTIELD
jgi:hypothetical protein